MSTFRIYKDGSFEPISEFDGADITLLEVRGNGWQALASVNIPAPAAPAPVAAPAAASSLIWARTEAEFVQAMQDGAANQWVPMFDPRTKITLTQTLMLNAPSGCGVPWGANGNYAQIQWGGPVGGDMIVFKGTTPNGNRCFVFEKFSLHGGGWQNACGRCLTISAPAGDPGSFYKFLLRDVYTQWGTTGIVLEGAVFEGRLDNCHSENHQQDGLLALSLPGAILSNIMNTAPNMSRNLGAGIRTDYSHNIILGSYILNAAGGVVAANGLRVGAFSNGENTGEAVFVVPSNGYGSLIIGNEASSDESTHARRFVGVGAPGAGPDGWVDVGKPEIALLKGDPAVTEVYGHVSSYGSGTIVERET